MARAALNKSALSRQKQQKSAYQRYLPALELKQKQLMAERKKAQQALQAHQRSLEQREREVGERLPMLAVTGSKDIDIEGLVQVRAVELAEENLVGVQLPVLHKLDIEVRNYSLLGRPHWFDEAARQLQDMMRLRLEAEVLAIRVTRLEKAVRTITQRVNLFSRILIPEAKREIKRISLFLADQERAGVVRSKLAKQTNEAAAT